MKNKLVATETGRLLEPLLSSQHLVALDDTRGPSVTKSGELVFERSNVDWPSAASLKLKQRW